jgi:heptosyltransferase-2
VVALGGGEERAMGEALAGAGAVDLTGETSLLEALAVLERCAALVTNDSGALHLARAAGTPVVAVFGSSSPRWTGPSAREGKIVRQLVACSPCYRRRCPLKGEDHLKCLRRIEVTEVMAALAPALESAG